MKVITRTNEFIAIDLKKKDALIELGRYMNHATCTVEVDSNGHLGKIICKTEYCTIESKYWISGKFLILNQEGNLVEIITEDDFKARYAILDGE